MNDTIIVALKYDEPEWIQTWDCIKAMGLPTIVVGRDGVGNMAKAYNDGFKQIPKEKYNYVWFISNITFTKEDGDRLIQSIRTSSFTALNPVYESDHRHLRPIPNYSAIRPAPFIEYTCPIVRYSVFEEFMLDEQLPYWGNDLDWSYRVTKEKYNAIGVHHGVHIGHTYIRNNNDQHEVTRVRKELRELWDKPTEDRLIEKYGIDWRVTLKYRG